MEAQREEMKVVNRHKLVSLCMMSRCPLLEKPVGKQETSDSEVVRSIHGAAVGTSLL